MIMGVGWMPLVADHVARGDRLSIDGEKSPLAVIWKRRTLFAPIVRILDNIVPTDFYGEVGFGVR